MSRRVKKNSKIKELIESSSNDEYDYGSEFDLDKYDFVKVSEFVNIFEKSLNYFSFGILSIVLGLCLIVTRYYGSSLLTFLYGILMLVFMIYFLSRGLYEKFKYTFTETRELKIVFLDNLDDDSIGERRDIYNKISFYIKGYFVLSLILVLILPLFPFMNFLLVFTIFLIPLSLIRRELYFYSIEKVSKSGFRKLEKLLGEGE